MADVLNNPITSSALIKCFKYIEMYKSLTEKMYQMLYVSSVKTRLKKEGKKYLPAAMRKM